MSDGDTVAAVTVAGEAAVVTVADVEAAAVAAAEAAVETVADDEAMAVAVAVAVTGAAVERGTSGASPAPGGEPDASGSPEL